MSITELVRRVKILPNKQAESQVKLFLSQFVGAEIPGDILQNRYKRKLKRRVEKL